MNLVNLVVICWWDWDEMRKRKEKIKGKGRGKEGRMRLTASKHICTKDCYHPIQMWGICTRYLARYKCSITFVPVQYPVQMRVMNPYICPFLSGNLHEKMQFFNSGHLHCSPRSLLSALLLAFVLTRAWLQYSTVTVVPCQPKAWPLALQSDSRSYGHAPWAKGKAQRLASHRETAGKWVPWIHILKKAQRVWKAQLSYSYH
jgi:hypothetical protein